MITIRIAALPLPTPRHQTPDDQARATRATPNAGGRFVLSDGIEHRCQTVAMSATAVALRSPVRGRIGEHVICYLEDYGRIEGRVARHAEDGFAVDFDAPACKRERLSQQLASWSAKVFAGSRAEQRDQRIEPVRKRTVLRLADGRHIAARLLNLSRSGAALTCPVPLALGEAVLIGTRRARVARVTQRLVGLTFDAAISPGEFTVDIVL